MTPAAHARVRVMVVDDHAIVRQGISDVLAADEDIEIVALVASGEEAVSLAAKLHPDVALMDLSMPGMDGVEATRRMIGASPGVRVVMLTSFAEPEHVNDALDAGAVGYLLKDADADEIVRAVKAASRGEAPFSARAAGALLLRRAQRRSGEDLTPREREVLDLVGQGLANKQISRRLNIKEKTVKAHLTNVFQRIGVSDRTSAALWAERHLH
jgi:Response regulator containing a CheY-like receiver domain and an HTH DNA-binding domain